MKKPRIVLICFGLFWSAITLAFDGFLGYGLINQFRAQTFAHTTGYITHSEVTTDNSGDDGPTHGVDIRYHYEVNGRAFEGSRFRYGAGSSSDSGWAERAVNQNREGAEVTVYYNPSQPSESVLSPGIDGSNLMMLLFMTPFNAVMLIFWFAGATMLRAKFTASPNGGVKYFQEGQTLRVRLPRYPAFVVLLAHRPARIHRHLPHRFLRRWISPARVDRDRRTHHRLCFWRSDVPSPKMGEQRWKIGPGHR